MSKGGSMSGRGTYDQGPMPQNPYSRGNQPRPSPSQAGAKMGGSPSMMGRGRGGQAPPNSLMAQLAANPNMPAPNQNIDIDNSSRQANVDFMNNMAQENALEGGMSPAYSYDPQTGQYARDSSSFGLTGDAATTYYSPQEFQSQFGRALGKMPSNQAAMPSAPIENTRADPPMLDDPAPPTPEPPPPPPPAPFVRPRPTRGLFQNQSGIASLRGQYQPQRQTQYQPMRNLNAPRYPAPPRRPPPRSQPRNRYPQPPSRMPRPYPQPPRGGPSKGGFPPPQRRPSGPTKGGRPDPRYATLTGRPQPTIPFNPKFYGR